MGVEGPDRAKTSGEGRFACGAVLPMKVRDLMTVDVVTVRPDATLRDVADLLLEHRIRSVPVVDDIGHLLGVVSESDVVGRVVGTGSEGRGLGSLLARALGSAGEAADAPGAAVEAPTAGDIMTRDVDTCAPEEPAASAARRMLRRDVRVMPVTDDDRVVGMLARHDILRLFDRPDAEISDRVDDLLANPLWAPEDHHVEAAVHDGVAILTGSVPHRSDVGVICNEVRHVPGVIEVVNRLTWDAPDPRPPVVRDTDWR